MPGQRVQAVIALSVVLSACAGCTRLEGTGAVPRSPVGGLDLSREIPANVSPGNPRVEEAQASSETLETGEILLTIRWPEQQGQRIQLLPTSAQLLVLGVKDPFGREVASASVSRQAGRSTATARMVVAAGSNYRLEASAFDSVEASPDLRPVARGDASGLEVRRGKTTQVVLQMVPSDTPAITQLTPAAAGPGAMVTLQGRLFGASASRSVAVRFGSTNATRVERRSDARIEVEVPAGATSGQVQVVVDGVPSQSTSLFQVIRTIQLGTWRGLPPSGLFLVGTTATLPVTVLDERGTQVPDPVLALESEQPDLLEVGTGFTVKALGLTDATASILARSGSVVARRVETIRSRPVQVTIEAPTDQLVARPSSGTAEPDFITRVPLTARVRYSDGQEDADVSWSVSDTKLGAVVDGALVSGIDAPDGTLVLTATARRDGLTRVEKRFEIRADGRLVVIVE